MSAEWRTGAVAVTGASGQVGKLLLERLAERSNAVVPLTRDDDWAAGIHSAEVVVHLAGTLQPKGKDTYESANVDTAKAVANAARESDVKLIVFLSYVGADPRSANAYLRSKGTAEAILGATGAAVTIFRCVHICGPPDQPGPTAEAFLAKGRGPVPVLGSGQQRIAPLYISDVAEAVVHAAVNRAAPAGTFELGGPDEMSMDEFVRGLNGGGIRLVHVPSMVARGLAHVVPSLTPALVDLMLRDNLTSTDPTAVAQQFGTRLHRFADFWSSPTG